MQSGLIPSNKLSYKYKNELHANELVLLAYYIAAINIEAVYHSEIIDEYTPFEGICLTDTFQMYETEDLVDQILIDNSARRKRQKNLDIQVIIGNPPYSVGQSSQNDNNQNMKYHSLDQRIYESYTLNSSKKLGKRMAYDSYIRAIRWASDRIGNQGIIGFVTNSKFIHSGSADGIRKSLAEEFSTLYVIDLRGAVRGRSGEDAKKEGQNIFDIMTGVAISILVKNPNSPQVGKILFHDIGDYKSKNEKLNTLTDLKTVIGFQESNSWLEIKPDSNNDWLSQRDDSFHDFLNIYDKSENNRSLFNHTSLGVVTNRDAWNYNASNSKLRKNIKSSINFFNEELKRYKDACSDLDVKDRPDVMNFVQKDLSSISWGGRSWKSPFKNFKLQKYDENEFGINLYRPFHKQHHYRSSVFNHSFYSIRDIFPDSRSSNLVIGITNVGSRKGFSSLITNCIPDLNSLEAGIQCFPLYVYEETIKEKSVNSGDLFDKSFDLTVSETKYKRKDGISDGGLKHFQDAYPNEQITKEDVFYYTYGLLHNEEYRERYADNLTKELPRIPCVKKAEDFWAFSKAGRDLAHLHLNYETIEPYKATLDTGNTPYNQLTADDFRVEKMKFAKKGEKGMVIYNKHVTIKDIPVEAYDYVVNGKSALEWVIDSQSVSIDDGKNGSGIINDANDWAIETIGNAAYPLELFLRMITVSLETMKIVKSLPKLDI